MDENTVFTQFLMLSGLAAEVAEGWRPLCKAACLRFAGLMRTDADPDDPRLALAAAGEVCYQYQLARGGEMSSLKIGDLSVSQGVQGGSGSPEKLRDLLWAAAAELLLPEGAGIVQVGE